MTPCCVKVLGAHKVKIDLRCANFKVWVELNGTIFEVYPFCEWSTSPPFENSIAGVYTKNMLSSNFLDFSNHFIHYKNYFVVIWRQKVECSLQNNRFFHLSPQAMIEWTIWAQILFYLILNFIRGTGSMKFILIGTHKFV
jgi:hypothetical protein